MVTAGRFTRRCQTRKLSPLVATGVGLLLYGTAASQSLLDGFDHPIDRSELKRLESDSMVVPGRFRVARVDREVIARSIRQESPLVLNLFNDLEVPANVSSTRILGTGSTFHSGALHDGGHFNLLLHHSGVIRGEVHLLGSTYALRSTRDDWNRVLIAQYDFSRLPICGNGQVLSSNEDPIQAKGRLDDGVNPANAIVLKKPSLSSTVARFQAQAKTTSNPIDVLVVYTQRVEDHEGGPEQIRAVIENEFAKTNQIFENSGLSHREIRLVAMEKVDYVQDADGLIADHTVLSLTAERNRNDRDYSALDEVHGLREEYQADLIHLFVRDQRAAGETTLCGWASLGKSQDDLHEHYICQDSSDPVACVELEQRKQWRELGFSVSSIKCTPGDAFAHELGHNFGVLHQRSDYNWDQANAEDRLPYRPYAFGYVSPDFSQRICQTTLMSSGGCPSEGIDHYSRVPYLSNPDLFFPSPEGEFASRPFIPNTPMGVSGDEFTVDLSGPVNASRAVDDVWDIVADLGNFDPDTPLPPTVSECLQGTPSNALESVDGRILDIPSEGATRDLVVAFPVPEQCSNVHLDVDSTAPFIAAGVEKLRDGEYRLSVTVEPEDGSSCETRSGRVTIAVQGVSHIERATISVTQQPSNSFCRGVLDFPEDSTSVDLSGRNRAVSLNLPGGLFAKFDELETLDLSNNRIAGIESATFEGLYSLTGLNLSRNEIVQLPPSAFADVPGLQRVA